MILSTLPPFKISVVITLPDYFFFSLIFWWPSVKIVFWSYTMNFCRLPCVKQLRTLFLRLCTILISVSCVVLLGVGEERGRRITLGQPVRNSKRNYILTFLIDCFRQCKLNNLEHNGWQYLHNTFSSAVGGCLWTYSTCFLVSKQKLGFLYNDMFAVLFFEVRIVENLKTYVLKN